MRERARLVARRLLVAMGIVAELVIILELWITLPRPAPRDISGSVRCVSGDPVVGVWVEGRSGGSWFADVSWPDGSRAVARYAYRLPSGGQYQVRVGCGGARGDWGTTSFSEYVDDERRDFVCDDPPDRSGRGTCR